MVLFLRRVHATLISYLICMSNCILYARCATVSDESIERQLAALHDHARLQGWEVVDEVADNGASGLRDDRPGLLRLLAACKSGEADIVLVQRLDRLSRSTTLTVKLIDALKEYGIRLESPDGRLSGVPDVAEFQRDLAAALHGARSSSMRSRSVSS